MVSVVLFQPQIPPNTGNIARTCAATQTPLHLIGPLGFEISDRYLKRAGLDYWPWVDLHQHETWLAFQHYLSQCHSPDPHPSTPRLIGFSTSGAHNYCEFAFKPNDWLIFGQETVGLPESVLRACSETVFIPIHYAHVRSLNLSVSVAIGLFEARRQLGLLNTPSKPRVDLPQDPVIRAEAEE